MIKLALSGIGESQRRQLADAGVRFHLIDKKNETIAFSEPDMKLVLDTLDATATQSAKKSDIAGVVLFELSYRANTIATPVRAGGGADATAGGRAQYIKVCGARIDKQTKQARKAAQKVGKKLAEATRRVFRLWRQDLFATTNGVLSPAMAEQLASDFEEMARAPRVCAVRIGDSAVVVETETLYGRHPKTQRRHEIGRFTIVIDLDGRQGCVRWFNIDRRVDALEPAMNAPYVFADGSACYNEMSQSLLELVARFELAVVVDLAIQFIENIEDDELGAQLSFWPLAD